MSKQNFQHIKHLLNMDMDQLSQLLAGMGQAKYRTKQIIEWVYKHGADDFEQMSNLPKQFRSELGEGLEIYQSQVVSQQTSSDRCTKLLLQFAPEVLIETVLIPEHDRQTVCVSTQVGCPLGCPFCASGMGQFVGNLTAGQIVEQVMRCQRMLWQEPPGPQGNGQRITHVVFMGMGEPMLNYNQTIRAIRILNAPWGLNIGARKITISTVGIPQKIRRLAREGLQINLAISLHAPSNELRTMLMPEAAKYPIEEIVKAAGDYFQATGREITLEYLLFDQINCSLSHAQQLAELAQKLRANVNLILYNPVENAPYQGPPMRNANHFLKRLRQMGVNAHLRTSRGGDIHAACGQLRRRFVENS